MRLCGLCGVNAMWEKDGDWHVSKMTGERVRCADDPQQTSPQIRQEALIGDDYGHFVCPTCGYCNSCGPSKAALAQDKAKP